MESHLTPYLSYMWSTDLLPHPFSVYKRALAMATRFRLFNDAWCFILSPFINTSKYAVRYNGEKCQGGRPPAGVDNLFKHCHHDS
jgi:hypothetical protein